MCLEWHQAKGSSLENIPVIGLRRITPLWYPREELCSSLLGMLLFDFKCVSLVTADLKKGSAYTNVFSKVLASPCFSLLEMEL